MNVVQLVGRVAGKLIRERLRVQTGESGGFRPLRVTGFERDEIPVILAELESFRLPGRVSSVQVVVAAVGEPSDYLSDLEEPQSRIDDLTFTHYRNRQAPDGLVMVELGTQGDREGLGDVHEFSDGNLLIGRGPDKEDSDSPTDRVKLFVDLAWESRSDEEAPQALVDQLSEVLDSLRSCDLAPSVRDWSSFAIESVKTLADEPAPYDSGMTRTAIASALPVLGYFPDCQLFDVPTKRLLWNARVRWWRQRPKDGAHVSDNEFFKKIQNTKFEDPSGTPLDDDTAEDLRTDMLALFSEIGELEPETLARTELFYWLQLFDQDRSEGEGLGDRVKARIAAQDLGRLDELKSLNVVDGLNLGDADAAELIIGHPAPAEGELSLYGLLTRKLKNEIGKLARSRESVDDPLVGILEKVYEIPPGNGSERILEISRFGPEGVSKFSCRLFALLYRKTLLYAVQASESGAGIRLKIRDELLELGSLCEEDGDDDETTWEKDWAPLELRLDLDGKRRAKLRWDPLGLGMASFGRLIQENGISGPISVGSLEELEGMATGVEMPRETRQLGSGVFLSAWIQRKDADFDGFRSGGLGAEELSEHVDAYTEILAGARGELVPEGADIDELVDLLEADTAALSHGRSAILGTHPIRLRWLAEHLRKVRGDLIKALRGELLLNSVNDRLYFDWLERVTPHQQPPMMATGLDSLNVATKKVGLGEEYGPLEPSELTGHNRWAGGADDDCVKEIAKVVEDYLGAFPHKHDGLSLLVLATAADADFPAKLAKTVRQKVSQKTVLKIHVVADKQDHGLVTASLRDEGNTEEDIEKHRARSLMPLFQVVVHDVSDFSDSSKESVDELRNQIDIAVAPDLFTSQVKVDEQSRLDDGHAAGHFDPWLDKPIHPAEIGSTGKESVLHLLPAVPDPLLEHWSTMTVRRKRGTIVADARNTDYPIVHVNFSAKEREFLDLHDYAHWVVTLDRFIGRDQIDAIEAELDIIHVKENVGRNDAYTLIVSSDSGKEFIQERFAVKLEKTLKLIDNSDLAKRVAGHLYECGRDVAPNVLLKALGLGHTAEEIIGLITLRWRAEEAFPTSEAQFLEVFLNLDDLIHWFQSGGGTPGRNNQRADMLRLKIVPGDHGGSIEMLVCESKYRDSDDIDQAGEQVENSIDLLQAAFCEDESGKPADRSIWFQELANAMSQIPKNPSDTNRRFPAWRRHGDLGRWKDRMLIEAIKKEHFVVTKIEGAVFSTNWKDDGPDEVELIGEEIQIVRTRRNGLQKILQSLGDRSGPPESQQFPEEDPPNGQGPGSDDGQTSPEEPGGDGVEEGSEEPGGDGVEEGPEEPGGDGVEHKGMTDSQLVAAYQKVLNVFHNHKVNVRKPTGDAEPFVQQGPAFYTIRVEPAVGVATGALTGKTEELKLGLKLEKQQEIRHYVDKGSIVFEIPKLKSERYWVHAEDLWSRVEWPSDALFAPIGEDITGKPVGINFSASESPHLLVAGTTGSGKSVALNTILRGLCQSRAPEELRLHLVDPKRVEMIGFADSDYLEGRIGSNWEDAVAILEKLAQEMERRYALFADLRVNSLPAHNKHEDVPPEDRLPWLVVVLDEYNMLGNSAAEKKAVEDELVRVAQAGRAAGIHVIVATQKPVAEVINSTIKSQLPAQLALKTTSNSDSRVILDENGAETLTLEGDALFKASADPIRIQCAMVSGDPD